MRTTSLFSPSLRLSPGPAVFKRVEDLNRRMVRKLFADQRQLSAQPPAFKQSRTGQPLQPSLSVLIRQVGLD